MYKGTNGRLTLAGVEYVHKARAAGKTYQQIATEIGVCITTVYNVAKQRTHASR